MNKPLLFLMLLPVFALCACGSPAMRAQYPPTPPPKLPSIHIRPEEMYPDNPQAQALVQAARRGDVKEIDRLIDAGADPNAVGFGGVTVPGWVLFKPNKAGFRRLLERGADPNKIWYHGKYSQESLMHMAVELSPEIGVDYLRMCLEIGKGDPNLEPPDKHRVIAEALRPQRAAAFALLYQAGAQIDYPSNEFGGYSLVGAAASSRNFKLTLFLLEHGVDYLRTGEDVRNRLQDSLQRTFKNGVWGGSSAAPEHMWFWRCVDWLEKRGMVFDYTPSGDRKPFVRPAVLDTTPPDVLNVPAAKTVEPPKNLNMFMHQVDLTFPLPFWADTPEAMRALASAMLTASLTSGAMDLAELKDLSQATNAREYIERVAQESVIKGGVQSVVGTSLYGGDLGQNLLNGLRGSAVDTLGADLATRIGEAARNNKLDDVSRMIAHAALGGAMAAADGKDAASGALGGVVGEITADSLSRELKEKLNNGSMTAKDVESWIGRGVDISKLAAGIAAAAAGLDVDTAAQTGGNAAQNNSFKTLLAVLYAAILGKGNLVDGLASIGRGDDPVSKAINGLIVGGVSLAASKYPDETRNILDLLSKAAGFIEAKVTYYDQASGGYVSAAWSSLTPTQQQAIIGSVTIVSLDADAIKKVAGLKQTAVEIKQAEYAASAAQKVRLSNQLTAETISTGHAFSKHAAEFAEIGIKTSAELQSLIENTMTKPSLSANLQNGRSFYFNAEKRVVVIVNPSAVDKGTAFVIDKARYPNPMSYINTLR